MNGTGKMQDISAETVPLDPKAISRQLTKLYRKVGPLTPAGHRISNILELIQQPSPHVGILTTQMRDLKRLLAA